MQNFFLFTVIQYVKDLFKVWHRYEVKIQKDTKRYDLRTYAVLWYFKRTYNKKAGLQSCCSANRGSGIAFRYKQQHRSPRRIYYYNKVRARIRAQ